MNDVLTDKRRGVVATKTVEGVLRLAEKAWQERVKIRGESAGQADAPLRMIVERLGR